jgi:membrane fusion protein (multidrug efflux system)
MIKLTFFNHYKKLSMTCIPLNLRRFKLFLFNSCLLAVLLSGCRSENNPVKENTDGNQQAAVAIAEAFPLSKGKLSSALQVPGELMAYQQVDLYAKESSFVKKLFVDVGSEVKQGQLLVTMEAPELGSQLAGALSNVKSREAIYTASKANYDRLFETSKTPGTISPNDLEQASARKNSDLAQWQAAKAAYSQVAETQGYLQIRAPFNGVITARNVNAGAYVGPSGKGSELPLFTLQEQKKLRLVVSVPEAFSSYLHQNSPVSFTVNAMPNEQFTGHIKRLSGAIDNRLHAQRIEIDVENNNKRLLPGMVAEVNIPLPSRDSTFVVPKSAVVNSTESVFVIRVANKKADRVVVRIGREANGEMEIFGDLKAGDLILKTATDEIRNGSVFQNLKIVSPSTE